MLTDLACRKAGPKDKDYRLADSLGLYLLVKASGHRSWRLGYWFAKAKKRIVLGAYPDMSLQDAREARDEARRMVARGIDPAVHRKQEEARQLVGVAATFETIAESWLSERRPMWAARYTASVEGILRRHVYPRWRSTPIGEVTKPMVVQLLKDIEAQGIRETAHRARSLLGGIFDHAEAIGYEHRNPTASNAPLASKNAKLQPAVTDLQQARDMLRRIEDAPAHPISKLASRFIALTAVRPGVAQLLPWNELPALDEDDPLWTIPAERMKLTKARKAQTEFDLLVPLAKQTVALLAVARQLTGRGPFVFASTKTLRRPISDSTVSKLYRDNGYRDLHVPHGWRSTFSTIMNERAMAAERPGDRVVIDIMLAHQQAGTEARYNRAAYMPRRRELAQEWADLLLEGAMTPEELLHSRRY